MASSVENAPRLSSIFRNESLSDSLTHSPRRALGLLRFTPRATETALVLMVPLCRPHAQPVKIQYGVYRFQGPTLPEPYIF